MLDTLVGQLYRLMHIIVWVHDPQDHRWMLPIFTVVLVLAPTWMALHLLRMARSAVSFWLRKHRTAPKPNPLPSSTRTPSISLERFVLRTTVRPQAHLVLLSLLTLPASYVLLLLPKHIVDHTLAETGPKMEFLGTPLGPEQLLFALCASYLLVLTASSAVKYAANVVRGRVSERIVRRIRLAVIRRRREEQCPRGRSTLAAVAIQECEPIGYFGGSLFVVPIIHGGTLLTSFVFLFLQDVALALAAVMMLPLQVAILPRLQGRINAKVRERVHATRGFNTALSHEPEDRPIDARMRTPTWHYMRQAEALERVRLEITELKARLKGLYNYTSSLTPFFFFSIGGYLVLQQRLSLGALVAALAAYREIAPSLRELFDFAQNWSDARARYLEVGTVLQSAAAEPMPSARAVVPRLQLVDAGAARRLMRSGGRS